ncbi:EF-P beta-lysylation protein EpmB [Thioalkalivibrio paradoxus]|uniref:L-lysine 2,3-aminomutase n=1 Tax=Thioalkalivibrio paradoxus ARh 1 TaxID=713585 RepID=W0DKQ3_9GAMM|nr:EF-P beta-lysylation protein EpmB [Thioalkalivibrio paradoxus]AHE99041.1 lysine 2,3-aminomutase [Thioalkalivibrio paradoxus ARh 1]
MSTNPSMIPRPPPSAQTPAWQRALAQAITDPLELLRRLDLPPEPGPGTLQAHRGFRTLVPESYLARMRRGDPRDPLLLQVLPQNAEVIERPGFLADPVGDRGALAAPGLLHKYAGRVLLVTTGACAIHCRYCFRREFPYGELQASRDWDDALTYIRAHTGITEVILSGGDPLALPDRRLADLVRRLETIDHLRRLRIHTRLPVVLPERVDAGLLAWLGTGRLAHVLVLHANHPREFEAPAGAALAKLRASEVTLLNQAVLLAGVNDDPDTLCELQQAGFAAGVLPYYLHLLDRARGTGHFEVDERRARALHAMLRERLPGYLVPRLVREIAGAPSKVPVPDDRDKPAGIDPARVGKARAFSIR